MAMKLQRQTNNMQATVVQKPEIVKIHSSFVAEGVTLRIATVLSRFAQPHCSVEHKVVLSPNGYMLPLPSLKGMKRVEIIQHTNTLLFNMRLAGHDIVAQLNKA